MVTSLSMTSLLPKTAVSKQFLRAKVKPSHKFGLILKLPCTIFFIIFQIPGRGHEKLKNKKFDIVSCTSK